MNDRTKDAILAAISKLLAAAGPITDAVENPLFQGIRRDTVACWALNKGFELTAEQVRTIASGHALMMLAFEPTASDAIH